ncbi:phthiocerol/phenolphthiocerol synthesis type-I polyketide synthase E [Thermoflexales bacterium]|nr:phthiocerol/phenolphthiocerol synthesis type-I polyketide synthase E [Thermoflexales bacterium]
MHELNLEGIAIVGMACRVPGAKNPAEFWQNLCNGLESITFFTDAELIEAGVDPAIVRHPHYVKARGIIGNVDRFEAGFFGLHAREASLMDPQHRLFIECAWEALENAGYAPSNERRRIGVFAGQSMNTYLLTNLISHLELVAGVDSLQASIGNDKDSLTTEVAYRLNLTGPAVTIQSSSSTSLTAIHYACQSLLSYECDMALAGGVSIHLPEKSGYLYHEGGITSLDGHCRAYDAQAEGFVAGLGAGAVTLKRLADAVAEGDTIYAVIKGSAVNNDGSAKVSYMAPSVDGQAEVVMMAQAVAGITPDTIGYVEGHGTGTASGDPIEVAALTQAFRAGTEKRGYCPLGSVKTNIGHLDAAAGVIGLIKTALMLQHKTIPPTLHFQQANPNIDFANSPFYVNTQLLDWKSNGWPRRAGVTSLGMGGTNAHAVLEETPELESSGPSRSAQLILLSARTDTALATMTNNLVAHLVQHIDLKLPDIAYTLQVGRKRLVQRRMLVCHDSDDALDALSTCDPERVFGSRQEDQTRSIVFMFSGQGAQYVNMGRELYDSEPIFREQLDRCCDLLKPHLGLDLRSVLYPAEEQLEAAAQQLTQTALTQPALFVIEYALAQLWLAWGLQPQAMIGHSIGEYVAACLAGVFSLAEALLLVAARGRLMQQMPRGAMLGVPLSEAEVQPYLNDQLSLAVVNSPTSCVIAGTPEAIADLQTHLEAQGLKPRALHTSHAFHSAMMEPVLPAFCEQVRRVQLHPPTVPYISNTTGTVITAAQATNPEYWAKHLRGTVRFGDGVRELLQDSTAILLEVGPGQTLSTLVRQHPAKGAQHVMLSTLRHPQERSSDVAFLLNTIGRLWLSGVEINWHAFYANERRRRVPLPTYPFERERYWIEPKAQTLNTSTKAARADRKLDIADWFYLPAWKPTLAPRLREEAFADRKTWLLFVDETDELSVRLTQRLMELGQSVISVRPGTATRQMDEAHWAIDPHDPAAYEALLKGQRPDRILHLWGSTPADRSADDHRARGFLSVLHLTQALGRQNVTTLLPMQIVTMQTQAVNTADPIEPEKAAVLGVCKVIPQEYFNLKCQCLDLDRATVSAHLIDRILAEDQTDPVVAYRGSRRWIQTYEAVHVRAGTARLREKGVYLITGGLGNVGYAFAETLAKQAQARLVLIGRTELPPRDQWATWLNAHEVADTISTKLRKIQALEELGAEVLVVSADVAQAAQLRTAIEQARAKWGAMHGVIHAAGTIDPQLFRAIRDTQAAEAVQHFPAKVQGAQALAEALRDQALDFCLLTSSLSAVLGGLGLAAYAAANAYLDAFVQRHNQIEPAPWMSVDWDGWQVTAKDQAHAQSGNTPDHLAITAEQGGEVLQRLLSIAPVPQLVISTSNLSARLEQWVKPQLQSDVAPQTNKAVVQMARPNLQTTYVAPRSELEQQIAQVWQNVLGLEQVGIYDSFFELGGNSLAGVQAIAQLNAALGVQIPTVTLYESPTINALAKLVAQQTGATEPEEPAYESNRSRGERRRVRTQQRRQE